MKEAQALRDLGLLIDEPHSNPHSDPEATAQADLEHRDDHYPWCDGLHEWHQEQLWGPELGYSPQDFPKIKLYDDPKTDAQAHLEPREKVDQSLDATSQLCASQITASDVGDHPPHLKSLASSQADVQASPKLHEERDQALDTTEKNCASQLITSDLAAHLPHSNSLSGPIADTRVYVDLCGEPDEVLDNAPQPYASQFTTSDVVAHPPHLTSLSGPETDTRVYVDLCGKDDQVMDTTEHNWAASPTISGMATHSPHSNLLAGPESEMRPYLELRGKMDWLLDTTVHKCEFCNLHYGGFDLLMHVHFVHNASYSEVCPCEACVVNQLLNTQAVRKARTQGFKAALELAGEGAVHTERRMSGAQTNARVAHVRNKSLEELHQRFPSTTGPLSLSSPSATKHAAANDSALVANPQDSRVDSASPMHTHSTPYVATKRRRPAKAGPRLLPNNIRFCKDESLEISERNLSYEVSQIESGELHEENNQVFWIEKKAEEALFWLDGDDKRLKSVVTGKPMRWLHFLPFDIPKDVPGWQLVCWYRQAAAEGIQLRHQDLYDRMHSPLSSSGIKGRVQSWGRGVGTLSHSRAMHFNWPSKNAMDTIAGLNYDQARFNTWWDVKFVPSNGTYIARQPQDHAGYRYPELDSRTKKPKMPHYFIENPEHRQISEQVKLIDDAMLFLSIKAEECGMTKGYAELLPWFGLKAGDNWTQDLDTDLVLEFERWRKGCPDTPSVSVLRAAIEDAGSQAEVEAIKNADYSLTPWLRDIVAGLAPVRQERRQSDENKRAEVGLRVFKRLTDKRKIGQLDDVEEGAGQSKRRAT